MRGSAQIDPTATGAPERHAPKRCPESLRLRDGLAFNEWVALGRHLAALASRSTWSLGDWMVYGETAYGERYRCAERVTGFDSQTLRNYAWVARHVDVSRQRDKLSFQHHAEVAAL